MPEGNQNNGDQQDGETPTFESWIEGQDEQVRGLIDGHVSGLRSALKSERDQRRDFEKQLREAVGQVEAGSEARKKLDTLTGQLETQAQQADFYEAAHAAGVANLRLAWMAVQNDESVLDRRGNVDMARLKEKYPELFPSPKAAAGNAGAGTQTTPQGAKGMNDFIRQASGRRTS